MSALILDVGGVLIETPTRVAREAWERAQSSEAEHSHGHVAAGPVSLGLPTTR